MRKNEYLFLTRKFIFLETQTFFRRKIKINLIFFVVGLPPKRILKGVSGRFRPGRLTAILGPSGAGKTSLLNCLTGFRTLGVKGSIRINGKERILQTFRKECCYITQEFAMLGLLTVKETFKSTSDLKLGEKVSEEKKFSVVSTCFEGEVAPTTNAALFFKISDIASILSLTTSMDTQVRHLSGGEKKRLSIGLELITNPPIMFFDEPTRYFVSHYRRCPFLK